MNYHRKMFRIASSLGAASRGIASLWLQEDSVKYQKNKEAKKVENEVKLEQHKLNVKKNELGIKLAINDKQDQVVTKESSTLTKDKIDFLVRPDSQDNEFQLLIAKSELMKEKNAKLEEEKLKKNKSLQQQQTESNKIIASLQNLLVSKDEEIVGLKADARKALEQFHACAEELATSKNQLLYKQLALDGVIKSNIKLQEQVESFRPRSAVAPQKELREDVTLIEKVSNGGSSVNKLDAGVIDNQKKHVTGRQQQRRHRSRKSKKKDM